MSDSSIWGTLTRADAGVDITLRHVYRTSVADLWSAVTEPDRLARWLGRVTGDLHEQGSSPWCSRRTTTASAPRAWSCGAMRHASSSSPGRSR